MSFSSWSCEERFDSRGAAFGILLLLAVKFREANSMRSSTSVLLTANTPLGKFVLYLETHQKHFDLSSFGVAAKSKQYQSSIDSKVGR